MSIAAVSFLSEVSCVRVLLPVKAEITVLLNGPDIKRSGSPPCVHAAWICDLTSDSVRARCVPSVAAVEVEPLAPPTPRATLVAYQPQSGRSWRGVGRLPVTGTWLLVGVNSMSRGSPLD